MKKPNKLLTNQHLLSHYKNNFNLAEEAIALAYSRLKNGQEFDLQKVLSAVAKEQEQEDVQ